jgi:hypothetical protein
MGFGAARFYIQRTVATISLPTIREISIYIQAACSSMKIATSSEFLCAARPTMDGMQPSAEARLEPSAAG